MKTSSFITTLLSVILKTLLVSVLFAWSSSSIYSTQLSGKALSVSGSDSVIQLNEKSHVNPILVPTDSTAPPRLVYGWPVSLTAPTVGISVEVSRGDYIDNEWNVSEDKAHFATITSQPNTFDGDTLIYAHNRPHLFQNTLNINIGDVVYVKTSNGLIFTYSYFGDQIVTPDNVSVFLYEGPPRLTLLTCHGEGDKYRRLLFFKLDGVTVI